MKNGVIDLLTVILQEKPNPKGNDFVAGMMYDLCAKLYNIDTAEYETLKE